MQPIAVLSVSGVSRVFKTFQYCSVVVFKINEIGSMSSFREILRKKLFESFKKSASDKPLKDIQCKTYDV